MASETDAQYVGYGAMLLEGALAVIVILSCCAGVGMGKFDRVTVAAGPEYEYRPHVAADSGQQLTGVAAWTTRYDVSKGWGQFRLRETVSAFVEGGGNFVASLGIELKLAIGIIAVLVASFAATTLDTATRLQRYVIQELAAGAKLAPLTNKYAATGLAVALGGALAMLPSEPGQPAGTGGLILWPLFGATNQLLAGLAFMVTVFYLWRRNKPVWFIALPTLVMLIMPGWALLWQAFNGESGWYWQAFNGESGSFWTKDFLLLTIALTVMGLQIWMVIEAVLMWPRAKGVLEQSLPPLETPATAMQPATAGGGSC
jgi:carbon starvation protein